MRRDVKTGRSTSTRAPMTIGAFARAIRRLPSDSPIDQPGIWYRTQKEHWLGWLSEYHGPGAYGRSTKVRRDAAFAYNHVVNWKMLLWLIDAAGVERARLFSARRAAGSVKSMAAKSGAVRKVTPWVVVEAALRVGPPSGRGR